MPQNVASDQGLHCLHSSSKIKTHQHLVQWTSSQLRTSKNFRCPNTYGKYSRYYNETEHSISFMTACVPSKDSDQHVHLRSLISLCLPPADGYPECPAKMDQTVQMFSHAILKKILCPSSNIILIVKQAGKNI